MPAALTRSSSSLTERTRSKRNEGVSANALPAPNSASGRNGSRAPDKAPASMAAPASSMSKPTPFQKRAPGRAWGGNGSMACMKIAGMINRAAQPSICSATGITGETIQSAVAKSTTPNACLMASIHAPDFGRRVPAVSPTARSGAPIPSPMLNRAAPPRTASPVWPM